MPIEMLLMRVMKSLPEHFNKTIEVPIRQSNGFLFGFTGYGSATVTDRMMSRRFRNASVRSCTEAAPEAGNSMTNAPVAVGPAVTRPCTDRRRACVCSKVAPG
jgi:hypothetical protein